MRATLTCPLPTRFQEIQNCEAALVGDKEVQVATARWFKEQPKNSTPTGSKKLVQRWRRCIERVGDYVEM